ncbi:hypothetical protein [Simplicispira suum]|uniref:hypothetical protein n=1 Tax=Simplicispira suum TaxID=2109915 RepID=UPI001FE263B2|nr:hypothetical protein [Simplicispira suum]
MQRRTFIRLAGGGTLAAAALSPLAACGAGPYYPAQAVEAWQGPVDEIDARRRAVAYAITAPNPHNLQPWVVDLREEGAITLRVDRDRPLRETDPLGRQILIGHGAFLELLVMALAEQGIASEVALWPQGTQTTQLQAWDERPVAQVVLRPGGQPDPLFAQGTAPAHAQNRLRHDQAGRARTAANPAGERLAGRRAGGGRNGGHRFA